MRQREDVVDVFTSRALEAVPPTSAADTTRSELRQADVNPVAAARGPGPDRPKEQEKEEPFSSKIEIALRDELDSYIGPRYSARQVTRRSDPNPQTTRWAHILPQSK